MARVMLELLILCECGSEKYTATPTRRGIVPLRLNTWHGQIITNKREGVAGCRLVYTYRFNLNMNNHLNMNNQHIKQKIYYTYLVPAIRTAVMILLGDRLRGGIVNRTKILLQLEKIGKYIPVEFGVGPNLPWSPNI